MIKPHFLLILYAVIAVPEAPAHAEDWPMYGHDRTRNAVSLEKNPPLDWQIEIRDEAGKITAPAKNIKWKADLGPGGSSFGSPVVSGGLVWVCSNNEGHRDPRFTQDMGCLLCFDEQTGKFRWQHLTPRIGERHVDFGGCSGSTPLVEGERLWFITNRWEVICLDIGPLLKATGEPREVWKLDMRSDLKVLPFSTVMSPSLRCMIGASYQGKIYVITGNGVDETRRNVPAPQAPSLVCIDKDSGKVIWSDNSPGKDILVGQWSSPLVAEINGKAQVIAPQGDGWIRSFDAMSGKLIWKCDLNKKSSTFPIDRNPIIAVPVLYQGRIYVTPGQDRERGEGPAALWCLDPAKEGDISEELDDGPLPEKPGQDSFPLGRPRKGKPNPNCGVVWKFDRVAAPPGKKPPRMDQMGRTVASVTAANGLVIVPAFDGFVHCLDASTGKRLWAFDADASIEGSPLICDGKIYIADEDGNVTVLALSRELQVLAQHAFEQPFYCAPIFANGVLFVTTRSTLYAIQTPADPVVGDWPQWRGPDRTNISRDTGLLTQWPPEGPPLVWKADGLGEGVPPVAVADGRILALGYKQETEYLTALDPTTGGKMWEAIIGPASREMANMRWLSQRIATVDHDRVYVFTARGELVCLSTTNGNEYWRKNYTTDFAGKRAAWGYCDFPLVDDDLLICTPGGPSATLVALDAATGALKWKCAVPDANHSTYGAVIVAYIGGVKQYIQQFDWGTVGIGTDGKLLWQYTGLGGRAMGNVHTAVVRGDYVFCSAGWGKGGALIKVTREGADFIVAEQYRVHASAFSSWLGNSSLVGNHLYANAGYCIDFMSGKEAWRAGLENRTTMVVADGHLYYRLGDGTVVLVEANPEKYVEMARFPFPRATKEPAWTSPVIAGGRLYLRDQGQLLCYDLRTDRTRPFDPPATRPVSASGPASQPSAGQHSTNERRANDAIFVPTPHDVVERMLQLAGVGKGDVVYDLGCGDGRIVVAAAKTYGCRAAGFDTDPDCVRMSRENVKSANVGTLVEIGQKDIFTLDLSGATVITLYMGREVNRRLIPQLQTLKPGSRIVSHYFDIEGYEPDKVIEFVSAEDNAKHTLYLWTVPLKKKGGA